MGKLTSIYLTGKEATELKKFCNENQCTQYSALKTALRELLSNPVKKTEIVEEMETTRNSSEKKTGKTNPSPLALWLKKISSE